MGSIPGLGRWHMPQSNWARGPQLLSLCSRALELKLLSPYTLEPMLCNKRSPRNEKTTHCNQRTINKILHIYIKVWEVWWIAASKDGRKTISCPTGFSMICDFANFPTEGGWGSYSTSAWVRVGFWLISNQWSTAEVRLCQERLPSCDVGWSFSNSEPLCEQLYYEEEQAIQKVFMSTGSMQLRSQSTACIDLQMDFWVNKPPDDPAPSFHINPNHWVFPAKAPDVERQKQAIPAIPYLNFSLIGSLSKRKWLF